MEGEEYNVAVGSGRGQKKLFWISRGQDVYEESYVILIKERGKNIRRERYKEKNK